MIEQKIPHGDLHQAGLNHGAPAAPPPQRQRVKALHDTYLKVALDSAKIGIPVFPLWPRDGERCGCGKTRLPKSGQASDRQTRAERLQERHDRSADHQSLVAPISRRRHRHADRRCVGHHRHRY